MLRTTYTLNNELIKGHFRAWYFFVILLSYGVDVSPMQMRIPGGRTLGVDLNERMGYLLGELAKY